MKKGAIFIGAVIFLLVGYRYGRTIWHPLLAKVMGKKTVADVQAEIGPKTEIQLREIFAQAQAGYPPHDLVFIAYKAEQILEVWAETGRNYRKVKTYPIQKLSGTTGPKLREGDRQVPEGIYAVEGLNPNSAFYLSLKLNYPNEFDLEMAKAEGRNQPGSDIFIHGKDQSIGCLAMGDAAIEEIFILAAATGKEKIRVIISPARNIVSVQDLKVSWQGRLYEHIQSEIARITRPDKT